MKKTTLYVIRHGETYLNKYKKMQGWSDAPLTEKGIKEAIDTGIRLKDVAFDAIFASDLGRTQKTATLIRNENHVHPSLEIIPLEELRETFFGSLDGSFASDVYQNIATKLQIEEYDLFKKLDLQALSNEIKELDTYHDAETMEEVVQRLKKGIQNVISSVDKEESTIMIVTHGNIIRMLVNMIDPSVFVQRELKNSGITTIEYQDGMGCILGFDE